MPALLSNRNYQPGIRNFGPFAVPDGLSYAKLLLNVTDMTNPAVRVVLIVRFSLDGGVTYPYVFPVAFDGGPIRATQIDGITPRTDPPPYYSYHEIYMPEGTGRLVTVELEIIGAATKLDAAYEVS